MTTARPDDPARIRPLPGGPPRDHAVRPRRWWDGVRGWPEGLPVDRRIDDRVAFELQRTSVREELARRSNGTMVVGAQAAVLFGIGWLLLHAVRAVAESLLGPTPLVSAVTLPLVGIYTAWAVVRITRLVRAPRLRAALRREGIDCCVRCGHLMARGEPAGTCPECGRAHADFPLGWGPGPIAAAAGRPERPGRPGRPGRPSRAATRDVPPRPGPGR